MEPKRLSSYHTSDEVLTLTSEHLSSEDSFDRKFKAKFYPYNQIFEQPEEYLIEFKGKQQMGQKTFSSEQIENKLLTLTSENSPSKYCFKTKLQANFNKSDQSFEQP